MEVRPWADGLPPDAAREILRRLPCIADRGDMAAVCRAWRALAETAPPPLPWLLLPGEESARVHCFLSDYHLHHHFDALPQRARCFGSHHDAWLFVAFDHTSDHEVINLREDRTYVLPDAVLQDGGYPRSMTILAAALSSPPPSCVVGGIGSYHQPDDGDAQAQPRHRFAFCAIGDEEEAYEFAAPHDAGGADFEVEDVLYHERTRAFYFLTRGEHILVCTATVSAHAQAPLLSTVLRRFLPGGRNYEEPVHARYIVESGDDVLMAVRFASHAQARTSSFRVFRAIPPCQIPQGDVEVQYPWSWGELDTLGARLLFVGRGCSRSYWLRGYPDFSHGICFLHDQSFSDEEMMFRDVDERQYPCSDIGKWSEGPPPGISFFFPEHGASSWSSAVWILPPCPRRLPDLPSEMLFVIFSKICDADMFRAVRACGLKVEDVPIRPQLPWLVLPFSGGMFELGCVKCSGDGAQSFIHPAGVPVNACGARLFGSFDERWIFLTQDDEHYRLINTFSGKMFNLPSLVRLGFEEEGVYQQKILAMTLSRAPDSSDCIAAAIIRYKHPTIKPISSIKFGYEGQGSSQISVWHIGDEIAVDPFSSAQIPVYAEADDILFHDSELHCISQGDHLFVWTPTYLPNGDLQLFGAKNWRHFFLDYELDKQHAHSRYLIESRGQLLVVVKYGTSSRWNSSSTKDFKVFRLIVPKIEITRGPPVCPFIEEPGLDGRMLFVGRGCSRSYEVTDYPGFREGIYFLDDRNFHEDDEMMFQGVNVRRYHCKDNGKWLEGPPSGVKLSYPQRPSSVCSPPTWLLP